jgi:hypothetical protein
MADQADDLALVPQWKLAGLKPSTGLQSPGAGSGACVGCAWLVQQLCVGGPLASCAAAAADSEQCVLSFDGWLCDAGPVLPSGVCS